MPGTRSPTGQYTRTRRPLARSALGQVVAEAAQHLELEVARPPPPRAGRRRSRGRSSAGCGRRSRPGQAGARPAAGGSAPRSCGRSRPCARTPVATSRAVAPRRLVIPVGALDQAHRERPPARRWPRPRPAAGRARRRVTQVRLKHQARGGAVAELALAQELERQSQRRLERVQRLHVDSAGGRRAGGAGAAAAAAAGRRPRARARAPERASAG